jgi:hypothetical protein
MFYFSGVVKEGATEFEIVLAAVEVERAVEVTVGPARLHPTRSHPRPHCPLKFYTVCLRFVVTEESP